MAYTEKSIKKYQSTMKKAIAHYNKIAVENVVLCVSTGNKKIGKVMNVSLPPMFTCGNCKECSKICYDIKANLQYPNTVVKARARNYSVFKRNRELYFALIDKKISHRKLHKFFRWHVAGDIVDFDYFEQMVEIARRHPDFIFWTYTKMYGIVNSFCDQYGKDAIPDNFKIMFSEWRGMPMDNPYGFPEFRVVFKDEERPKGFYCPGNCDVCKKKKLGCIGGHTTYCLEH